jgi:hypothetical protein
MKDAAGVVCGTCFCLLFHSAIALSADVLPSDGLPTDLAVAYIVNEDSHPHRVSPGESARFSLEPAGHAGRMDVKCSLEADDEMILTGVTLRTQGLDDVKEPLINSGSFTCIGKMRQIKAPIAGNSQCFAKIGNAELAHFNKQVLIHELIRGSLYGLSRREPSSWNEKSILISPHRLEPALLARFISNSSTKIDCGLSGISATTIEEGREYPVKSAMRFPNRRFPG